LLPVLLVFPAAFSAGDELLGVGLERDRAGRRHLGLDPHLLPMLDRVFALTD
jgi:hypothetical protein